MRFSSSLPHDRIIFYSSSSRSSPQSAPTMGRLSPVEISSRFDGINGGGDHESLIPKKSLLNLQRPGKRANPEWRSLRAARPGADAAAAPTRRRRLAAKGLPGGSTAVQEQAGDKRKPGGSEIHPCSRCICSNF